MIYSPLNRTAVRLFRWIPLHSSFSDTRSLGPRGSSGKRSSKLLRHSVVLQEDVLATEVAPMAVSWTFASFSDSKTSYIALEIMGCDQDYTWIGHGTDSL